MKVHKNWLEWLVFAVSLAIVTACLALLAIRSVRSGDGAPGHHRSARRPQPRLLGLQSAGRVQNGGGETAEGVIIEVALISGGEEVERGEFTIAFLPRRPLRAGWVVFERDRACCTLRARTLGFEKP